MRNSQFSNHVLMRREAEIAAIRQLIIMVLRYCKENMDTMFDVVAPNVFLIPISLFLFSNDNDTRPYNPVQETIIAMSAIS